MQKLKFNFTLVPWFLVCTMFHLYIHYLACSLQCILGDVSDGEFLSVVSVTLA